MKRLPSAAANDEHNGTYFLTTVPDSYVSWPETMGNFDIAADKTRTVPARVWDALGLNGFTGRGTAQFAHGPPKS